MFAEFNSRNSKVLKVSPKGITVLKTNRNSGQ